VLAKAHLGIPFNEHIEGDGPTVFAHACKMGLEGVVSKRKECPNAAAKATHVSLLSDVDLPFRTLA
jgi:ATP-dependent DNA ligase